MIVSLNTSQVMALRLCYMIILHAKSYSIDNIGTKHSMHFFFLFFSILSLVHSFRLGPAGLAFAPPLYFPLTLKPNSGSYFSRRFTQHLCKAHGK